METIKVFDFNRIYQVAPFQKELRKALAGFEEHDFSGWYFAQLKMLDDDELNFIEEAPRRFEFFGNGLYAITYRNSKKNIRILFTIKKQEIVILLCAFVEAKASDYDINFRKALRRMKEIKIL